MDTCLEVRGLGPYYHTVLALGHKAVLWMWRGCVLVFLDLLLDEPRHGYVECMLFVVSFEAHATIHNKGCQSSLR